MQRLRRIPQLQSARWVIPAAEHSRFQHSPGAMHLAGRCAGCAECERVCPMDIPLNLLNRKMAKELKELYAYEAGFAVQEKGPLSSYDEKDDQSFIK